MQRYKKNLNNNDLFLMFNDQESLRTINQSDNIFLLFLKEVEVKSELSQS